MDRPRWSPAGQRAGSDQIGGRFACSLSLTIRHTYIRVAALQRLAASRRRGPWSRAPNPSVPSQRESERGRGRERDRTYFHFSPVFAHGGNQRQLALVAREADQIVVCVVGHLLELFCQKSGLGLEESLPFRRRKHGKSNSCVQASSRHRNPPAQQPRRFLSPPLELAARVPRPPAPALPACLVWMNGSVTK